MVGHTSLVSTPVLVNGDVSFWLHDLQHTRAVRPPLAGDHEVDVCIVGGGFTGLWTAYYLSRADPSLTVAIVEREFCGFGASGRNGGWVTAALAGARTRYARTHGRDAVVALQDAMVDTVTEVLDVAAKESIDADVAHGGNLSVACSHAQDERLHEEVADHHAWGDDSHSLLTADEVRERVQVADVVSGSFTPHCARINPGKLVLGLADVVEQSGVEIFESTTVTRIEPGRVTTDRGVVRARQIVRATEGFTASIPGERRRWLPMNSGMIATEPLPDQTWDELGWSGLETIGDMAHAYLYAQRTADGRIAIGGRGVPYRFGSRTDVRGATQQSTIDGLHEILRTRFPLVQQARIDHAWAGVLGVPRDWCSTVNHDRATGLAAAGGYVGHGVATTNLAGRTLRDLLLGQDTALTALPWVGRKARLWEPEPIRWLGVQAMYAAYRAADRRESRGGRTALIARVADRISGR